MPTWHSAWLAAGGMPQQRPQNGNCVSVSVGVERETGKKNPAEQPGIIRSRYLCRAYPALQPKCSSDFLEQKISSIINKKLRIFETPLSRISQDNHLPSSQEHSWSCPCNPYQQCYNCRYSHPYCIFIHYNSAYVTITNMTVHPHGG